MRSVETLLWLCVVVVVVVPGASAFAPASFLLSNKSSWKTAQQVPSTRISGAFMPEHVDTISTAYDQLHQWSSLILSDAATAATADADTDGGWWSSYLGLFKAFLTFIHSTIDQPLRDHGISQTWGVSIALFTAGEFTYGGIVYPRVSRPYIHIIDGHFCLCFFDMGSCS